MRYLRIAELWGEETSCILSVILQESLLGVFWGGAFGRCFWVFGPPPAGCEAPEVEDGRVAFEAGKERAFLKLWMRV